jgi:hemoglobin
MIEGDLGMQRVIWFAVALLVMGTAPRQIEAAQESGAKKPTKAAETTQVELSPDEQVAALEAQCAQSAEARAARHAERSLFERLGGEEKIHALTRELVRLHLENEDVKHLFDGLDAEKVAHRVALFIISGTGGPAVYDGPELETSHAHMELTNADFLAAGGDVIQAMKNLGHGQNEIDEMVCALVGLRHRVVLAETDESSPARP